MKARCYSGCGKPARRDHFFCSNRCASEWAEELVLGDERVWCCTCNAWVDEDRGPWKHEDATGHPIDREVT